MSRYKSYSMKYNLAITSTLLTLILFCISGCSHKIEVYELDQPPCCPRVCNPKVKVFMENSGSMDGYMTEGSMLKDAVYSYIIDLMPLSDTIELNYINSRIIPFKGTTKQYIKALNPGSFKKYGGDRSNSDLSNILDSVLMQTSDSTICIFISDCILDLPGTDASKFLNNCKISIKESVTNAKNRVHNLGIEILKMESDFNGNYYYQNGCVEKICGLTRPYYIWIIGDSKVLASINKETPILNLKKYGLREMVSFVYGFNPSFTVLNNAGASKIFTPRNGNYFVTIKANLGESLQPEDVLLKKDNYSFFNPNLSIKSIQRVAKNDPKYTHCITFRVPESINNMEDNLVLTVSKLPEWVSATNDSTGRNIRLNHSKTTGIQYIVEGVNEAFKKQAVASLKFRIKRR